MVEAESRQQAIIKTINWAVNEYPGLFDKSQGLVLKEPGYPLMSEVKEWQ